MQYLIKSSGDELLALFNKMASGVWFVLILAGVLPQFPSTMLVGRTYGVMGVVALVLLMLPIGIQVYRAASVKQLDAVRHRVIFPIGLLLVGAYWCLVEITAYLGDGGVENRPFLALLTLPFALGTAVSKANTPFHHLHHFVQSCLGGTAVFAIADLFFHMHNAFHPLFRYTFISAVLIDLLFVLFSWFKKEQEGGVKYGFWVGGVLIGHILPFFLAWAWLPQTWLVSAVSAIVGLYFTKYP